MKKSIIIITVLLVLLIIWTCIFSIDCHRTKLRETPLFCKEVIDMRSEEQSVYKGIGYKIFFYRGYKQTGDGQKKRMNEAGVYSIFKSDSDCIENLKEN